MKRWCLIMALPALLSAGCARPSTRPPAGTAERAPAGTPAAPPAAKGSAIRFAPSCFDPYAECEPYIGLPALSGDHRRLALADTGPESPRDEILLTVRVVELASGRTVSEVPIVTPEDYATGDYGFTARLAQVIGERARGLEQALARDGYQPLTYLGSVHATRPGQVIAGMRATFDGATLVIRDADTQEVLWQREIAPSPRFASPDDDACGPFPVADVSVWALRKPAVAVARVAYVSTDLCLTELPYVILR